MFTGNKTFLPNTAFLGAIQDNKGVDEASKDFDCDIKLSVYTFVIIGIRRSWGQTVLQRAGVEPKKYKASYILSASS